MLRADERSSESVYSKIADSFEDDLLDFEHFPEEYFQFAEKLFSEEVFYRKPGLWNLLLALSTESHKLQQDHYERLLRTFVNFYPRYENGDLCLAVCDFVARNVPEKVARKTLNALKHCETEKPLALRGFADDGLRILELEVERNRRRAAQK